MYFTTIFEFEPVYILCHSRVYNLHFVNHWFAKSGFMGTNVISGDLDLVRVWASEYK